MACSSDRIAGSGIFGDSVFVFDAFATLVIKGFRSGGYRRASYVVIDVVLAEFVGPVVTNEYWAARCYNCVACWLVVYGVRAIVAVCRLGGGVSLAWNGDSPLDLA